MISMFLPSALVELKKQRPRLNKSKIGFYGVNFARGTEDTEKKYAYVKEETLRPLRLAVNCRPSYASLSRSIRTHTDIFPCRHGRAKTICDYLSAGRRGNQGHILGSLVKYIALTTVLTQKTIHECEGIWQKSR